MKTIIISSLIIILALASFVWIAFPAHPSSWLSLKRGMTRSEVLNILDVKTLSMVDKFSDSKLTEEWYKKYFIGKWVIRLYYYNDITLHYAHVRYESKIPLLKTRMRIYD